MLTSFACTKGKSQPLPRTCICLRTQYSLYSSALPPDPVETILPSQKSTTQARSPPTEALIVCIPTYRPDPCSNPYRKALGENRRPQGSHPLVSSLPSRTQGRLARGRARPLGCVRARTRAEAWGHSSPGRGRSGHAICYTGRGKDCHWPIQSLIPPFSLTSLELAAKPARSWKVSAYVVYAIAA